MKDFAFLRLLDLFSLVFVRLGINYDLMRKIIKLKLLVDGRRTPTIMSNTKKNDNSDKNQFYISLIFYVFYGLMMLFIFFIPGPIFFKMTLILGFIMFVIITMMISDFSSILLDLKDRNILLTKPVDVKTLNMAKLVHIFYYLSLISLAISAPSMIAGLITIGLPYLLIFIPVLFLLMAFVIFLTSLLYGLVLKFYNGEKLKNIINYVQIAVSIALPLSYQFSGEMFEILDQQITYTPSWWHYVIPSSWFAAPFALFIDNQQSTSLLFLCSLAIIIPLTSLLVFNQYIAPYFEKNLSKLTSIGKKNDQLAELRGRIAYRVVSLFNYNRTENITFRFMKNMLGRERKLKLTIYPFLGFSLIFPLIMMKNLIDLSNLAQSFSQMAGTPSHLFLYFTAVFIATTIPYLSYSENYQGAWLYKTLPFKNYLLLQRIKVKVVLFKYALPLFTIHSIIFCLIFGITVLADILVIILAACLLSQIIAAAYLNELPFSLEFGDKGQNSAKKTAYSILIFLLGAVMAGLHLLAKSLPYGVLLYFLIILAANIYLWKTKFTHSRA